MTDSRTRRVFSHVYVCVYVAVPAGNYTYARARYVRHANAPHVIIPSRTTVVVSPNFCTASNPTLNPVTAFSRGSSPTDGGAPPRRP